MIQRHVWVSGRVQGVGFRASVVQECHRVSTGSKHVKGWVRNLPDGRVEAVFQGPENAVLCLVAWCRQGPPEARVQELEVREEPIDMNLTSFDVLR